MNTNEITISQEMTARLQRVGTSLIDGSQKSKRPAMMSDETQRRRRPTRVFAAGLTVLLGGATISAVVTAQGPSNPIVGMIPKGMTHDEIFVLGQSTPSPEDSPSWFTLISVYGGDAAVAEATNSYAFSEDGVELVLSGRKVRISEGGKQSSAWWQNENKRFFALTMPKGVENFQKIVEATVASTATTAQPGRPTELESGQVQQIERWDLLSSSLFIQPIASVGTNDIVASIETSASAAIAQRMLAGSREPVEPFRSGRFLVIAPPKYRDVRPLRRNEFVRTVAAVDRDRSKEIEPNRWTRIAPGVDFAASKLSDPGSMTCVRTTNDVACSRFLLNRRFGKRWVYSTVGVTDVRVNGVAQKPLPSGPSGETQQVFLLPSSVQSIVVTSAPNGRDLVSRTVAKPSY
jgi:hypothetical protein